MSDHYWNWQTSSAFKVLRSGQKIVGYRTLPEWQTAMKGHVRDAHKGAFVETCAACREIKAAIEAFA